MAKKIDFVHVLGTSDIRDTDFLPAKCDLFPDSKFIEAKRLFARIIKQTSTDGAKKTANYLKNQIVCADIPTGTGKKNDYCNCLAMLASAGDRTNNLDSFTAFDIVGQTYLFIARNGEYCLANFIDDDKKDVHGLEIYHVITK